jgi:hypothetical protein
MGTEGTPLYGLQLYSISFGEKNNVSLTFYLFILILLYINI